VADIEPPISSFVLPTPLRKDAPRQAPESAPLDEPPEELPLLPLDPPLEPLEPPDPPDPPLLPPLLEPASPVAFEPDDPLSPLQPSAMPASADKTARMRGPPMNESVALEALVRDVDLLCLDAGNTVVFLDHARLAHLASAGGFRTTADTLVRAEGEMKHALERGALLHVPWSQAHRPAAQGWASTVATILSRAGAPEPHLAGLLDALWPEHCAHNLWSIVPEGLVPALGRARACGVKVAAVSNSEGMLEALFRDVGVLESFDLVVDSGLLGVEKPDPRIFQAALERTGVPASRALHLGDNYATDVLGARAAGVRVALVDPYGHLEGRHPDVPRVEGAAQVADALASAR